MDGLNDVKVDYTLLRNKVPPIAGPGSELGCLITGWSWCGYCGYTGRVLGPRQASCPERHGWHRWLEQQADLLDIPSYQDLQEERKNANTDDKAP